MRGCVISSWNLGWVLAVVPILLTAHIPLARPNGTWASRWRPVCAGHTWRPCISFPLVRKTWHGPSALWALSTGTVSSHTCAPLRVTWQNRCPDPTKTPHDISGDRRSFFLRCIVRSLGTPVDLTCAFQCARDPEGAPGDWEVSVRKTAF